MQIKPEDNLEVSIVIVCMKDVNNLFPCLNSIMHYTKKVTYNIYVVAYLFSEDNLRLLKANYPHVIIIESNDIKGFSENNNLALRLVESRYCLVLNDDTFLKSSVIDKLVLEIEKLPRDIAAISPNIKYPDGREQFCGVAEHNLKTFVFGILRINYNNIVKSPYVNKLGVFQTYNLMGAAFLIKTDIFRNFGFFDETYFFCPEDVALSTALNKKGYKCYVDADNVIYHIQGGTWSKIQSATMPAHMKGSLIFHSNNSSFRYVSLGLFMMIVRFFYGIGWFLKSMNGNEKAKTMYEANFNVCATILSNAKPKEIFIKCYENIKNN